MLLVRLLARVIGALLMLALALVCLGVALFCVDSLISLGSIRPDRLVHLSRVHHHVGHFLTQIAAPGSTADLALAGGVVAVVIGLVLLVGVLRSSREKLVILEGGGDGTLAVRPRVMRAMVQALAEQTPGATAIARPALKLSRRGTRGRLTVNAARSRAGDPAEIETAVARQIEPLSGGFHLRARVRVREGESGERVQ